MESDSRRPRHASPPEVGLETEPTEKERAELPRKTRVLLRQGDGLYRMGLYPQAIHVWTRILFLDRGNVEAREAIERAKRAQAEKQRKLDVIFVEASKLLDAGDRQQARRQLARILAMDPRHSEGRSLWEKLETLERRGDVPSRSTYLSADPEEEKTSKLRRLRAAKGKLAGRSKTQSASPLKMAAFLFCAFCLLGIGGLYLHLNWDSLISDRSFVASPQAGPESLGERDPKSLPLPSELHYYNGARLYAKGYYREALSELARVDRQSGFVEEARSLVLRIEERLLRGAVPAEPTLGNEND